MKDRGENFQAMKKSYDFSNYKSYNYVHVRPSENVPNAQEKTNQIKKNTTIEPNTKFTLKVTKSVSDLYSIPPLGYDTPKKRQIPNFKKEKDIEIPSAKQAETQNRFEPNSKYTGYQYKKSSDTLPQDNQKTLNDYKRQEGEINKKNYFEPRASMGNLTRPEYRLNTEYPTSRYSMNETLKKETQVSINKNQANQKSQEIKNVQSPRPKIKQQFQPSTPVTTKTSAVIPPILPKPNIENNQPRQPIKQPPSQDIKNMVQLLQKFEEIKVNLNQHITYCKQEFKRLKNHSEANQKVQELIQNAFMVQSTEGKTLQTELIKIIDGYHKSQTDSISRIESQILKAEKREQQSKKQHQELIEYMKQQAKEMKQLNNKVSTMEANNKKLLAPVSKLEAKIEGNFQQIIEANGQLLAKTMRIQEDSSKQVKISSSLPQKVTEIQNSQKQLQQKLNQSTSNVLQTIQNSSGVELQQLTFMLSKFNQEMSRKQESNMQQAKRQVLETRSQIIKAIKQDKKREVENFYSSLKKQMDQELKKQLENQKADFDKRTKALQQENTLKLKQKLQKLKQETELTINLQSKLEELQIYGRFLAESKLYFDLSPQKKKFLHQSISKFMKSEDFRTKTLFQVNENEDWSPWLSKINSKKNLLCLLQLSNKHIIAGFSEDGSSYFRKEDKPGKGFLASITNKKLYLVKPEVQGRILTCADKCISFGFEELVIHYDTCSTKFGRGKCYFQTGSDRLSDFIGSQVESIQIKRAEFHAIVPIMLEKNMQNK